MRSSRMGAGDPLAFTRAPAPLSPLGTARQRLAHGGAAAAGAAAKAGYPIELLSELRDVDLGEESLFLAWQIAAWAEALSPVERRTLTAVIVRSLISVAEGSTRYALDAGACALLSRAPEVVGSPGDRRPFIIEGGHLYQQRLLACEDRLAALLRARLGAGALADEARAAHALGEVLQSAQPRLTAEQAAAVRAALVGRLTVVSGGPGTGKTTIVLAIVRALVRLGLPAVTLALAAPTGKAANRLEEAVKGGLGRIGQAGTLDAADQELTHAFPSAQTIHRLLGYSPKSGTFQHHRNNRLAQKVIIVDESSMIDLSLMERLVRAVPDDARLILLGDADQLASVEAGAVFRDLTPLALRLTRSHRMDPEADAGRRLLELAAAVRDGDSDVTTLVAPRAAAVDLRFEGAELVTPAGREELLERWYREKIAASPEVAGLAAATYRLDQGRFGAEEQTALERLQRYVQGVRILCVTRGRPTGTVAVNDWLRRRHGGAELPFAPGAPIMMLRNDYDRGLYNGDQGLVIRLQEDGARATRLAAAFPTRAGWAAWPLDGFGEAPELELSFAMTVHKAQGSEHDQVALLLPDAPMPLLTRELLYTAITRARRAVVICGSAAVLAAGAAAQLVRSSGLGEKLGR